MQLKFHCNEPSVDGVEQDGGTRRSKFMQTYDFIVTDLEEKNVSAVESVSLPVRTLSVLEFGEYKGKSRNVSLAHTDTYFEPG